MKNLPFLLLLLAVASGCDMGPAPSTPATPVAKATPAAQGGAQTPAAAPAADALNSRQVQVGDLLIRIVGFKRYQFIPGKESGGDLLPTNGPTNGAFGIMLVQVTNRGSSPAQLKAGDFSLSDSSGHAYAVDEKAATQYSGGKQAVASITQLLPAGATSLIGVPFDLPAAVQTYLFHAFGSTIDPGPFPAK